MGWWKVQDTDDLVGDEPFDILAQATTEVLRLYQREFGRSPTRTEWQRLLHDALEPLDLEPADVESLFHEQGRPSAVEIVLETPRKGA
jgi:hypothetical protein